MARHRSWHGPLCTGALILVAAVLPATPARATGTYSVAAGWDLFTTATGTRFGAPHGQGPGVIQFVGEPLGTYNFGGSIGVQNTGTTDTIVRRSSAVAPTSPRTAIELVALQLKSTSPAGFYATLQSNRGLNALDPPDGPASTGTLDVAFNGDASGGTFDSRLQVNYDIRAGSLTGPIVFTGTDRIKARGFWDRTTGTVHDFTELGQLAVHRVQASGTTINGVNTQLNGSNTTEDFHAGRMATATSSGTATGWNGSVAVGPDGGGGFEPTIDVGPDGHMYITAATGVPSFSTIWRSTDNGATWMTLNNLLRPAGPGGGDIDLTVSPTLPGDTDALVPGGDYSLSITELYLGSSSTCRNDTTGGNGITPNIANEVWVCSPFQGVPLQDRQWVAAAGNDVVYHLVHQLEGGLVVSKSLDGGITYPIHVLAATPVDQNLFLGYSGNIVAEGGTLPAGANDKVGFVYSTRNGVAFQRSFDGGATWSRKVLGSGGGDDTTASFPVISHNGTGDLHAVWLKTNSSAGTNEVMYASSTDWGVNWTAATAIVSTGTSVYPWVDARDDKVAVSLYHTTSTASNGAPASVPAGALWYIKYLQSTNGGSTWSALATPDATSVFTGPICIGLSCPAGTRTLGDFQSVALNPINGDRATIAYMRVTTNGEDRVRSITQS